MEKLKGDGKSRPLFYLVIRIVICDTDCDMASKTPLYGFPYARGYQYTPLLLARPDTPFNRAI